MESDKLMCAGVAKDGLVCESDTKISFSKVKYNRNTNRIHAMIHIRKSK